MIDYVQHHDLPFPEVGDMPKYVKTAARGKRSCELPGDERHRHSAKVHRLSAGARAAARVDTHLLLLGALIGSVLSRLDIALWAASLLGVIANAAMAALYAVGPPLYLRSSNTFTVNHLHTFNCVIEQRNHSPEARSESRRRDQ